jgi:SAM-dependent MidA family methyltransferase
VSSGLVAVVDYGHTAADRPHHGTLTGFRGGHQVPPVPDGSCDLTAHVAFDSLARVADEHHLTTQGVLLRQLVGAPAGPVPHRLASSDPAAYLSAVARRAALTALTAPGGPGDFRWLLTPRRHSPA